MKGINKITDRIAAEAREEIAAIQADTAEKCREIELEYEKLAKDEYDKILAAGQKDCELQVQRLASAAAMESKKSILTLKQTAVGNVLELSVKRLCSLPEQEYIGFLAKLAGNAAFTGQEELIFNARDKANVSKAVTKAANDILKQRGLPAMLTVSELTGDFMGGVMVKQGDIEVNCSVEKLVELSKEELAAQIAEVLFEN